jgi:hypothetical protein
MTGHIHERFAPLTRSVSEKLNEATPAAYKLWGLMRQDHRPEVAFNFKLKEAADVLGYSVRWLKTALDELIDLQLVEQIERWWGQCYRLIIYNPGQKTEQKNDDRVHETSKIKDANAQSSVPLSKLIQRSNNGVSGEQKRIWYDDRKVNDVRGNEAIAESLYIEVQKIAPDFNPKVLLEAIAQFGERHVRNAVSAIQEQMDRGNTRNPAAALFTAIFRGFTANEAKRERRSQKSSELMRSTLVSANGSTESEATDQEPHFLPGTTEMFVVTEEERSRLQAQVEAAEQEFRQRVQTGAIMPVLPVSPVPVASVNENVVDVLAQISIVVREAGLDRDEVRGLLEGRYGVRSQQSLNAAQLRDWLAYLQTLKPLRERSPGGIL